jgi:hypothetical protein
MAGRMEKPIQARGGGKKSSTEVKSAAAVTCLKRILVRLTEVVVGGSGEGGTRILISRCLVDAV